MRIVLVAAFLLSLAPVHADDPELNPAEGATVHALATDLETIEHWATELDTCPLERGRIHTLADVQKLMPKDLRNQLVVQDGWTQPFRAWCDDQHWAIISYGANGTPDADYAALPELADAGDDFVVLDGDFGSAPEHIRELIEAGKQRRTQADIRSIGIVFEAFALDNDVYPGDPVTQMEPVSKILPQAQPVYIRTLPLTDGWGNPFRYWTDGVTYRIASAGRDGVFETDYSTHPGTGEFDPADLDRDIVFGNGEFEQWPVPGE